MDSDTTVVDAFVEFADAFSRLESIAALYPVAHTRSREMAERLQGLIGKIAGEAGAVSLRIGDERLMLGQESIPLTKRGVQGLYSELACLGLSAIEIQTDITPDELHQLAGRLRAVSQRIVTTHSLKVVDLGALPPTVKVRYREFGRRVAAPPAAAPSGSSADQWVKAACAPLEASGLDEETRATCKGFVKQSMRKIVERVEHGVPFESQVSTDTPRRSLDDVLQLAGRTLEHALSDFLSDDAGHGGLQRMFQSIEMATAVCEDQESARLMVDVLRESAEEVLRDSTMLRKPDKASTESEAFQLTLADLQSRLGELKSALGQMTNLEREDRSEALSILLGALPYVTDQASAGRVVERLQSASTAPLTRQEKQTLLGGIQELCAGNDDRLIDRALPQVCAALGEDIYKLWLSAMVQAAEGCAADKLAPFWPHLAAEVLRGPRTESDKTYFRAMVQLGRLPKQQLEACMLRLQAQPNFCSGTISNFAFARLRDDLGLFYAALLRTSRADVVGELMLASLKANVPPWPGGVVFLTFPRFEPACRDFLLDVLQRGELSQASHRTQAEGCRLVAKCLDTLPCERADEAWVLPAIDALGGSDAGEAARPLQRILRERKFGFLPRWPRVCREAARRALADSNRPSAAGSS